MSHSILVSAQAQLRTDAPAWAVRYLEGICGPDASSIVAKPPPGPFDDTHGRGSFGPLPDGVWFEMARGSIVPNATGSVLLQFAGSFHDDFVGNDLAFFGLLASIAAGDQVLGSVWIDEEPARATTYAVRRGELFAADTGSWRGVLDPAAAPPVEHLADGRPDAQRAALATHGAGEAALAEHDRVAAPHEPTLARHLLARSVARALAALGAEAATADVLAVLDAGADPVARATTPGWWIGETWPAYRGRRATSRVLSGGIAAAGAALSGSALDGAPVRLATGMVLVVREPIRLRTQSSRESLVVAPGERLVVGHVYERGHAQVAREGVDEVLLSVRPEHVGSAVDVA